jgi:EAL domain-containing protein (putative c-di-GMP-specific phosphodiesterase class I)
VETEPRLQFLKARGCDEMHGYGLSRVPCKLPALLRRVAADPSEPMPSPSPFPLRITLTEWFAMGMACNGAR